MPVLWILLLVGLLGGDAEDDGRRGNLLYEQGEYEAAESAYRSALSALPDSTGKVYAALQNNLGAALYRQDEFTDAQAAFTRAHEAALSDEERARALYNAGNAAARDGSLETAMDFFRRTLLADPSFQEARANYEIIHRQLQERRPQGGSPPPDVDPSAFAERLKRQAEALVAEQAYSRALTLMENGLERDSTVRAYRDFIQRLRDVSTIDDLP
ncbi:MAG: tetratricopeptide repeat protein [Bacteroidetes bacterium]|jgi:tetratricopeptide (TPR) repeat protein|nr:tetratricopeptide repeat protein [Bacteroidota bacterium]